MLFRSQTQVIVIRLVSCGSFQFRNAGFFGKCDPDLRIYAAKSTSNPCSHRLNTELFCFLFAEASQKKAEAAQKAGALKDEIVPVEVKKKKETVIVDTDEGPRHGTTVETLAKLKPAFKKDGGKVTAGNSSGINDGFNLARVSTVVP